MVNFVPLTTVLRSASEFGTLQKISTGFAPCLRYCTDAVQREVNQTLHDVWQSSGLVHDIYIVGGSCPLTDCQVPCVQVLPSILAALLHGTRAVGVSQTLRRRTRKGITELLILVCATNIQHGGHHVGHQPTF